MNLGTVGDNLCLGGIFDLGLGSDISSGGGNPSWVVGDTFLVRSRCMVLVIMQCLTSLYDYRKTSTLYSAQTHHQWALPNCRTLQAAQVRLVIAFFRKL